MPISAAGCLGNITTRVSPRGKRSSSSLSRVAGLIRSRGSLSKDPRAIKINDPPASIAIGMALPVMDTHLSFFFLPFSYPAALIAAPTNISDSKFSSFALFRLLRSFLNCTFATCIAGRLRIISVNYLRFLVL